MDNNEVVELLTLEEKEDNNNKYIIFRSLVT